MKEIYQELYSSDPNFFSRENESVYYIVVGIKGKSFEDDLAIPVTKEYLSNSLTLKQFLDEYILNKNEDSFIEYLQLGNIVDIDINLRQRLKNTFNELRDSLSGELEIYREPLDLGPDWETKGQHISEKKLKLEHLILDNLMYIEINSPEESYVNVKQYMVRLKICPKKEIKILPRQIIVENFSPKFGPIETPVIDYDTDKFKMMRMEVVKGRIAERKKWLSTISDADLLYLIFAPIRFLRFKHSQNKLLKSYAEQGKAKPPIVSDIRDNSLFGGVWEYKDLEFLAQIDLLILNKIIVPTDFNYNCPPYTTMYKAIKDGVLLVGGIEHNFESPKEVEINKDGIIEKIKKPGHFISYTCMKKMGSEGTQVLIKYQNELGATSKMLTCKEMDLEMADMEVNSMDKKSMSSKGVKQMPKNNKIIKKTNYLDYQK